MPFRKGFRFDKVISTQVISHIPERERAIKEIWDHLEEKGLFVLTVGNDRLLRRMLRPIFPKEALREKGKGIGYYHFFSKNELYNLLKSRFNVEEIFGVQNLVPLVNINQAAAYFLEKIIQRSPISHLLGNILLAKCCKGETVK